MQKGCKVISDKAWLVAMQMAHVCFNLSYNEGKPLSAAECRILKGLQEAWDKEAIDVKNNVVTVKG